MSVSISVWLKDILPRTPGIVRSVAKRELINAAREFYRQTGAWREVVENTYFDSGDYQYTVIPYAPSSEVIQVMSVEVNGSLLDAKAERPVGDRASGTPTLWFPTGLNTVEIWPTPELYDDDVRIRVVLIPTEDAVTLPSSAYAKYYEALLDGVLGRLYGHPAKPYSNPAFAEYHLRRFRNAIGEAVAEQKGGGFAGQNWQYPRFGK
jgi:hypothetical protein